MCVALQTGKANVICGKFCAFLNLTSFFYVKLIAPFSGSQHFWDRMNYTPVAIQEAAGQLGGLWALKHNSSSFLVQILAEMSQCVSLVLSSGSDKWIYSGVYASPARVARNLLWSHLRDICARVDRLWAVLGDFNDILLPSKQRGGSFSHSQAEAFVGVLANCNILDLDFFGSKFTWHGHCRGGRRVFRQLDRGVCDVQWRMRLPEASVEHLFRCHSDHNPILLHCCHMVSPPAERPYRFQAAWCTHSAYPPLVKFAWQRDLGSISQALQNVQNDSISFNKHLFGNIIQRKRKLEARLRGIQRTLEHFDYASLIILQRDLLKEYE